MKRVVDSYSADGVKVTLLVDNDKYSLVRKDGKYSYVQDLGYISRDEAQFRFGQMING